MTNKKDAVARLLRIADREQVWMEEIGIPDASSIGAFLRDVAEMLREQEPIKPIRFQPGTGNPMLKCGACLEDIKVYNYCPWCGRKVKWIETN